MMSDCASSNLFCRLFTFRCRTSTSRLSLCRIFTISGTSVRSLSEDCASSNLFCRLFTFRCRTSTSRLSLCLIFTISGTSVRSLSEESVISFASTKSSEHERFKLRELADTKLVFSGSSRKMHLLHVHILLPVCIPFRSLLVSSPQRK